MLLRIAIIVFPIFVIAALGYLYGRRNRPEMATINRINMDVFLLVLVFHILLQKEFAPEQYGSLALGGAFIICAPRSLWPPWSDWRSALPP